MLKFLEDSLFQWCCATSVSSICFSGNQELESILTSITANAECAVPMTKSTKRYESLAELIGKIGRHIVQGPAVPQFSIGQETRKVICHLLLRPAVFSRLFNNSRASLRYAKNIGMPFCSSNLVVVYCWHLRGKVDPRLEQQAQERHDLSFNLPLLETNIAKWEKSTILMVFSRKDQMFMGELLVSGRV